MPVKTRGGIAPILLVILILFNGAGYYISFNLLQDSIHREIRAQIRKGMTEESLTRIEVSYDHRNMIRWLEKDREFIFQGEMYDLVKVKSYKDKIVLFCIHDTKEKKLIADFARNNDSSQKARRIFSNINIIFVYELDSQFIFPGSASYEFCLSGSDIRSNILEIADPPPKLQYQA